MAAAAPAPRAEVARELERAGIAAHPFDPAGILVAAEVTGFPAGVVIRDGLVLGERHADVAGAALATARKLVVRYGVAQRVDAEQERLALMGS